MTTAPHFKKAEIVAAPVTLTARRPLGDMNGLTVPVTGSVQKLPTPSSSAPTPSDDESRCTKFDAVVDEWIGFILTAIVRVIV